MRTVVGVCLALLLAEAVLRQIYWHPMTQDPDLGAIAVPGETVRRCIEGCAESRWQEGGVRRGAPPDPSRASLLVLGDSFTEGLMVDDGDVFTDELERRLAEEGPPLQVLNLGRSGANGPDYVALAPVYLARHRPRWTVLQLREGDVASPEVWRAGRSHFREASDGRLEAVRIREPLSRFTHVLEPIRRRSTLANYGIVRAKEFAALPEPPLFGPTLAAPASPQAPAEPPRIAAALELFAEAYSQRLTFLFLPDFPADLVSRGDGSPGAGPVEAALADLCRLRGWSCVNLRDAFPEFAARRDSPYGFANTAWNQGHMNARGHRAAAALLAEELERLAARGLL